MNRSFLLNEIDIAFKSHPIVGLLGPRQCGKTTLAKHYIKNHREVHFFDLEDPIDLARLENPKLTLGGLAGLIVIDEIQRVPELFPLLRVLADQKVSRRKFLILGSASRDLIRQSSESLAGRIRYIEVRPFSIIENCSLDKLWLRGGFPRSFLSKTENDSNSWRKSYISNFLERDIPNLGIQIPAVSMRKFWMMLAHYHGQIWNASEIGKSLGFADTTAKRYLDILTGTFMVRTLQPWHENIGKRQIKSPKIFFRDSGVFHTLLGVISKKDLLTHPKLGASWEGFAIESVIASLHVDSEDCFFWGTHGHAELDLMTTLKSKRVGFEIKFSDAPKLTPSMKIAMEDLKLHKLTVVYPGNKDYKLTQDIDVRSLSSFQ